MLSITGKIRDTLAYLIVQYNLELLAALVSLILYLYTTIVEYFYYRIYGY